MEELRAFTRSVQPSPVVPLALFATTIAVIALEMDAVRHYSEAAFLGGCVLAATLAAVIGRLVRRGPALVLVPALGGAVVGMAVQSVVLVDPERIFFGAIRDLGGAVDTMHPVGWILSGIVLGGLPALGVAVFLVLLARVLRRREHDRSETSAVVFTGGAGILAALVLQFVTGLAMVPLLVVVTIAMISLVVSLVVDGARRRFLRRAFEGTGDFTVMPVEQLPACTSLDSIVADLGAPSAVLVRVESRATYRGAAAEPVGYVGATLAETVRPLSQRTLAATIFLAMTFGLTALQLARHV